MTDRIDDDTDLTHAVRFYPLSSPRAVIRTTP
jgi:hypothetical protein